MSFLAELKRRKVVRVGIAYAVAAREHYLHLQRPPAGRPRSE